MEYSLQNRWVIDGKDLYYYGMRSGEKLFCNRVPLSKKQRKIILSLPRDLSEEEKKSLGKLLGEQVVSADQLRKTPASLQEARFCTECAANDYIIPGLEFDQAGRCPMCQTAERSQQLKSLVPVLQHIPRSRRSRFDVALFYTGGKDSAFLLYHLAKKQGLRVLALTWEIPFMSASAKASIENAKKHFENVEFITRSVSRETLRRVYGKLYELSANTCACPSLAYLLFYPELVANRVPYFLVGNEPVQVMGLYYNHMAPKFAYRFARNRFLSALINIGRILILHPPLRRGQLHTLMTMKQLAYGDHILKKLSGYTNALVSNVVEAIHQEPQLLPPLRRSIRASSWSGNIPAFVQLDFDTLAGGRYDWHDVKETLVRECGWVAPDAAHKALHTSCSIERCKDHSQFIRFYHCQSKMIPFSAIEISLASRNCADRDKTIYEMEHLLGFSLEEPQECAIMRGFLEEEK